MACCNSKTSDFSSVFKNSKDRWEPRFVYSKKPKGWLSFLEGAIFGRFSKDVEVVAGGKDSITVGVLCEYDSKIDHTTGVAVDVYLTPDNFFVIEYTLDYEQEHPYEIPQVTAYMEKIKGKKFGVEGVLEQLKKLLKFVRTLMNRDLTMQE